MPTTSEAREGAPDAAGPRCERRRLVLGDGSSTTLHVARFNRSAFGVRVIAADPPDTVLGWCRRSSAAHAVVGGFYVRPGGPALGDLWIDGRALPSRGFDPRWHAERACLHSDGDGVRLAPRSALGDVPHGDLLHAGPMLVRHSEVVIRDGVDPEGFSAGAVQFDSDITVGRYPRTALGLSGSELIAVVCEGRADAEAGLTLAELAAAIAALGAEDAINLDGGGSSSLVVDGKLLNTPREEHGLELVGGRPVATILELVPLPLA